MYEAIVIGGGVAGLSAALALVRSGYSVKLLEEAPDFAPAGAALSLWGNGISALNALGVGERVSQDCARINAITASSRAGQFIMKTMVDDPSVPPARMALRSILHEALLEALGPQADIHLRHQVTAVEQSGDRVRVLLSNAAPMTADLVIVADGIGSAIGSELLGNPAQSAGYGGILALSDRVHESAECTEGREFWGVGERLGMFRLRDGRHYWYHMVSGDRSEPPAAQYARLVAGLADWAPEVRTPILSTNPERLIPVRIWSRPPPTRLGLGRVIVVGDAAHAMEPNLGQGACQGLEDAAALAAIAPRVAPDQILPMLEQLRLARVKAVVRAAGFRSRIVAQPPNRVAAILGRLALQLTPASTIKRAFRTFHRAPDYEGLAQCLVDKRAAFDRHELAAPVGAGS